MVASHGAACRLLVLPTRLHTACSLVELLCTVWTLNVISIDKHILLYAVHEPVRIRQDLAFNDQI